MMKVTQCKTNDTPLPVAPTFGSGIKGIILAGFSQNIAAYNVHNVHLG